MKNVIIVLVVLLLVLGGCGIATNNRLVSLNESISSAEAQVDAVLQRRYDLIPNLVETVKGYAKHESGVLEEVTKLRSQWAGAGSGAQKVEAANQLEGAIGRLMVVVEKYPDLKADSNFLKLQDELAGTENRISVERQRYNETVRSYNTAIAQFPGNLIAGMHGFQRRDVYFKSEEAAKTAPKVKF